MMELPSEVVAGGLVAAGLGVLGWLFKVAAGETLRGLREAITALQKSVDSLTNEVRHVNATQADHESRLSVMEDRLQR